MELHQIIVDNTVVDFTLTDRILSRFPDAEVQFTSDPGGWIDSLEKEREHEEDPKKRLLLTRQKGAWLKSCPGTKHHVCCKYLILNVANNCHMDCSYCILQNYFQQPMLVAYVNIEELFEELQVKFRAMRGRLLRIGTGELTDSLTVDGIYNLSERLIPFFRSHKNKFLELKTKAVEVDHLLELEPAPNTILSWSVNPSEMIEREERGTPPLDKRIQAAQMCQIRGYRLGLHFDPIILFDGWEEAYSGTVQEIFKQLDPDTIVWISMGCLRFPPELKEIIRSRFPRSRIIYEEFIKGRDGKMRYLMPQRIEIYSHILSEIEKFVPREKVYFCMERPEVWEAVLGEKDMTTDRLGERLDRCALGELREHLR